jgi:hypothetical protein
MRCVPFILMAVACGGDSSNKAVDSGSEADDTGGVSVVFVDADRDGHLAEDDCDDNDWRVYPGADEICDGKDNDCNGETDEGFDPDGDGAFDMSQCSFGTDCDEANTEIPSSEIPYDGIDQDCDGSDMADVDGDGFDARAAGGNDCDDFDDEIHPGATEVPRDDVDQNCDGDDLVDGDGDGFDADSHGGDDCDDDNAEVNPDALDWYDDGEDSDCDGSDGGLFSAANAPVTISGTTGEYALVGHDITICDLDSDGISDVVVSAPYAGDFQGAVGVFYGRNVADWGQMTLEQADTYLLSESTAWGFGVACADVNGDGNDDLIIGQGELQFGPFVSDFSVHIIYGLGGMLPGMLDDLDADATLTVDLGAPGGVGVIQSGLLAATDLSGDGAADIIIDQNVGNTASGASELWAIPGNDYVGVYAMDELSLATIGDPQGDTVSTLRTDGSQYAVGQASYRPGLPEGGTEALYPEAGKVAVLGLLAGDYDSFSDAAQVEFSLDEDGGLGSELAFGDFDGDGATDLAMGAPLADGGVGCVYLISDLDDVIASGGPSTVSMVAVDAAAAADKTLCGEDGVLGEGIRLGGDVDGDGINDLLVSEAGADGVGVVWLVSGDALGGLMSAAGPSSVAMLGIRAQYPSERIGQTMDLADLDGDGLDDLIIGSSHHPSPATVGLAMSGRVSIFLSSHF